MGRYGQDTEVPVDRSIAEIRSTIQRYGATSFMHAEQGDRAAIMFELEGRRIRMILLLPDRTDPQFRLTPTGKTRKPDQVHAEWSKATRQLWRAMALVVKAKLEAVESGITTLEEEFLAHIVLPSGDTVHQWLAPQIDEAYRTGTMPPLLPQGSSR